MTKSQQVLGGYKLLTELKSVRGTILSLAFSPNGKFLISGGDNQEICVWNVATGTCTECLRDANGAWGAITVLTWVIDVQKVAFLCFGTARGIVSFQSISLDTGLASGPRHRVQSPDHASVEDPVEALAFDRKQQRLAIANHSGVVTVYKLCRNLSVRKLGATSVGNMVIPKGLAFIRNGERLIVYTLLTGRMYSFAADTLDRLSDVDLNAKAGYVAVSQNEAFAVVHDIAAGNFSYHAIAGGAVQRAYNAFSRKPRLHQCVLNHDDQAMVCGSDHGKLYVFNVHTTRCEQSILVEKGVFLQAIAGLDRGGRSLVAAGNGDATTPTTKIHIYSKTMSPGKDVGALRPTAPVIHPEDLTTFLLTFIAMCAGWQIVSPAISKGINVAAGMYAQLDTTQYWPRFASQHRLLAIVYQTEVTQATDSGGDVVIDDSGKHLSALD